MAVSVLCLFLTATWVSLHIMIVAFPGHTYLHFGGRRQGKVGSAVVECLTRDLEVAGSSLTGVTALWSLSKKHLS